MSINYQVEQESNKLANLFALKTPQYHTPDPSSVDFCEGYYGQGPIYIGNMKALKTHVDWLLEDSRSWNPTMPGSILSTDRPSRPDGVGWTYERNMNFMAGVISARRIVILLSSLKIYKPHAKIGVTLHEIMWLVGNDYEVSASQDGRFIILTPRSFPNQPTAQLELFVDEYGLILDWNRHNSKGWVELANRIYGVIKRSP